MTREEAIDLWQDANDNRCCSCHISPPCDFCVSGFSISLDEYLALWEEDGEFDPPESPADDVNDAYERAMKGI